VMRPMQAYLSSSAVCIVSTATVASSVLPSPGTAEGAEEAGASEAVVASAGTLAAAKAPSAPAALAAAPPAAGADLVAGSFFGDSSTGIMHRPMTLRMLGCCGKSGGVLWEEWWGAAGRVVGCCGKICGCCGKSGG
jgi:hypothetical protein